MSHSRKKLDLAGQLFVRLTVLRPAENIGRKTGWLCQCDCGGELVAKTYHLRSGHVTSCGCADAGIASLTFVDGTCLEMLRAKTVRSNNTSGVPGVFWRTDKRRWRAMICFKGRRYNLGSYRRFEDAVKARKEAEERFHDSFVREFSKETKDSQTAV